MLHAAFVRSPHAHANVARIDTTATPAFPAGAALVAGGDPAVVGGVPSRPTRHAGVPIEGRAAVASWDAGDRSLTLWSGTQIPHLARHALAVLLGMAERRIRVVAPDVGGGFGVKASLYPEEVAVCPRARAVGRPRKRGDRASDALVAAPHRRGHAH